MMRLDEFKELSERKGKHWFKPDTMRFFKSKIHEWDVITGRFISSEKGPDEVRRYTVRQANFETGDVETVGRFQEFKTLHRARKAMRLPAEVAVS